LDFVLDKATRLLQATVDVISSSGWLAPALATMELSQMCVQGVWDRDSALLQLPHFTHEIAKKCAAAEIETIFDLMDMDDDKRDALLDFTPAQLAEVARVCNRYPNIDLNYEIEDADEVAAGDNVSVIVTLQRDGADDLTSVPKVHAPRFPKPKEEGWWLIVGDPKNNSLLSIKRITLQLKARVKLDFTAPPTAGEYSYTLYLMCDSYLGCDQEYELKVDVGEADDDDDDDDED